jgi:hypothetical protein
MMSTVVKGAGMALTGAAKFVPVVGQVVSVVSAINDVVNAADNVVKGARQDYQSMAGPQFSGSKFINKSQGYNTTIRDVKRNNELGVSAKEWNNMFGAMNSAGMPIDAVEKKLGGLSDVMETVRKTSLVMGTSLDVTGEMFAKQSQSMRAGLKTIQKGMMEVAKGAKVAGMETNKFYDYVLQSTNAMAAYGDFTSQAANAVKHMASGANTSQEEGAAVANKSTTWITSLDPKSLQSLGAMMLNQGGEKGGALNFEKYRQSEYDKRKKLFDEATTADEKTKYQGQMNTISGMKNKPNDEAMNAGRLLQMEGAEAGPKTFEKIVRMLAGGDQKSTMTDILNKVGTLVSLQSHGISSTDFKSFQNALGSFTAVTTDAFDKLNTQLELVSQMKGKKGEDANADLQKVADILQKGSDAKSNEVEFVKKYFSSIGADSDITDKMLQGNTKAIGVQLAAAINDKKNVKMSAEKYADEAYRSSTESGTGFEADQNVTGQSQMIKALTPLQKYTEIAKDALVYNLSDTKALQSMVDISTRIRMGVFGILSILTKDQGGEQADKIKKSMQRFGVEADARSGMMDIVANQNEIDAKASKLEGKDKTDFLTSSNEAQKKSFTEMLDKYKQAAGMNPDKGSGALMLKKIEESKDLAIKNGGNAGDITRSFLANMSTRDTRNSLNDKNFAGGGSLTTIEGIKGAIKEIDDMQKDDKVNDVVKTEMMSKRALLQDQINTLSASPVSDAIVSAANAKTDARGATLDMAVAPTWQTQKYLNSEGGSQRGGDVKVSITNIIGTAPGKVNANSKAKLQME